VANRRCGKGQPVAIRLRIGKPLASNRPDEWNRSTATASLSRHEPQNLPLLSRAAAVTKAAVSEGDRGADAAGPRGQRRTPQRRLSLACSAEQSADTATHASSVGLGAAYLCHMVRGLRLRDLILPRLQRRGMKFGLWARGRWKPGDLSTFLRRLSTP
jgi:hypothetical protein